MEKLRYIMFFILLVSFGSCENDPSVETVLDDLYTPYLRSEWDDGQVILKWQNPICLYRNFWGCPQKDPDFFAILFSTTGPENLEVHSMVKGDVFEKAIDNLVNGDAYYFAIKSVGKWGQSTTSNTVMTIPDFPGNIRELLPAAKKNKEYGSWSPERNFVAYAADYIWNDGNNAVQSVFILDLLMNTENLVEKSAFAPEWSPIGQKVVYHTSDGEQITAPGFLPAHIAVYDRDDNSYIRLTQGNSFNFRPTWSPDGEWIAYLSDADGGKEYNIRKVSVDGSTITRVTSDFGDLSDEDLAIMIDRSPHNLTWSHDGETIAFDRLSATNHGFVFDIYSVPSSGGTKNILLSSQWNDFGPAYSPNGSHLAFISDRSGSDEIWTIDLQSGELKQVTGSNNLRVYGNPGKVEWSRSGDAILFTASEENYLTLFSVGVN